MQTFDPADEHGSKTTHRPPLSVLVLTYHPAHYRDPTLVRLIERGAFRVRVVHYQRTCDSHPEWGLATSEHPAFELLAGSTQTGRFLAAVRLILRERPDIVLIPGMSHPSSAGALVAAYLLGIPYVYSADTVSHQRGHPRTLPLRELALRLVVRAARSLWVPGRASRSFFRQHGIPDDRIFEGCYCLDAVTFAARTETARAMRTEIRRELGIREGAYVFLFLGSMISQRRVPVLLEAFSRVAQSRADVSLLLVGGGPDRSEIEAMGLRCSSVRLVDAVPLREVPRYYAASDAFVHPGREAYSLPVIEAALAGLPIISTRFVGAAKDVLTPGRTGLFVEEGSIDSLAGAMRSLAASPTDSVRMGALGRVAALSRTPDWASTQLERALRMATRPSSKG